MFKKTLIAFSAMAAFGIASPGFADSSDESELDMHEENSEVRLDRTDAAQDNQDAFTDGKNTAKTSAVVKRDSEGRECVYIEDGVEKIREGCE